MVCASGKLAVGDFALVSITGSFMLASSGSEVSFGNVLKPAVMGETGEGGCVDGCVNGTDVGLFMSVCVFV